MDLKKFSKTCKKREADRKMERQRIRRSHNYLIGFPGGEKGKKKKKLREGNIWGENGWDFSRLDERQESTNMESSVCQEG